MLRIYPSSDISQAKLCISLGPQTEKKLLQLKKYPKTTGAAVAWSLAAMPKFRLRLHQVVCTSCSYILGLSLFLTRAFSFHTVLGSLPSHCFTLY